MINVPTTPSRRPTRLPHRRLTVPLLSCAAALVSGLVAGEPAMAATVAPGGTEGVTVDLSVTMTVSPRRIVVGENATYEIVVSNETGDVGRDVRAAVRPDYQVALVSMTSTQGTCYLYAATCDLGAVAAGSPATVSLVVRTIHTDAELSSVVEVSTVDIDRNPTNDEATAVARVVADPLGCTIVGSDGDDLLTGGAGRDVICGRGGDDDLHGDDGRDELRGEDGVDYLFPEDGDDLLLGGRGGDYLYSSPGDDEMDGQGGADTVGFLTDLVGVTVDLRAGTAVDGYGGRDRIVSVGYVYGSEHADVLHGSALRDRLNGYLGDDRIFGHGRGDVLVGNYGDDAVNGGAGVDECEEETGDVLVNCEGPPARRADGLPAPDLAHLR